MFIPFLPLDFITTFSKIILGLCGNVLVVGGGYRGGFCEKLPEASPISDGANASRLQVRPTAGQGQAHHLWDKIVRMGEKVAAQQQLQRDREVRRYESNNSADTQVGAEGGGGGAPGARAEVPLQPMEQTMVRQAVPLQPREVHSGADLHL